MAHKVFICYSSKDKIVADAACAAIEASRISCWIAPRDILAGDEWGDAIIRAISTCDIVLVIFSQHVNGSPQCRREIERAVSKERIIVPFRIDDMLPSGSLEYALSNTHWLDAITPPIEARIAELADNIGHLLQRQQSVPPPATGAQPVSRMSPPTPAAQRIAVRGLPAVLVAAFAALVLVAAGVAGLYLYRAGAANKRQSQPQIVTPVDPPGKLAPQPKNDPQTNSGAHSHQPKEMAHTDPQSQPKKPPPPADDTTHAKLTQPNPTPSITPEQKARLDQLGMKIEDLSLSAEGVNASLNNLAQSMQKQGITLNGKWTGLQVEMNGSLVRARDALKAQDADRAERYAVAAGADMDQIKTFLGR